MNPSESASPLPPSLAESLLLIQIDVLDKGYVRLVDFMGSDQSVVRAARVSYNAEPRLDGSDDKLIHSMMRRGHTSPFEHVSFTFEVKLPLFVIRQWHRHRTWKYNEVSGRYSELPDEFYVPAPENVTTQHTDDKQMRTTVQHPGGRHFAHTMAMACAESFSVYKALLEAGCPRELARGVLPLNTYTRMFATVDLHNLFHFLRLRLDEHAQWEIRVYAEAMLKLIRPIVPVCVEAFIKSTMGGTK